MEMPGLWKGWKAKSRLPTLSTSPLEISPTAARFPHSHSSDDEGGWKSGKPKAGFPPFHRPESLFQISRRRRSGFALRRPAALRSPVANDIYRSVTFPGEATRREF